MRTYLFITKSEYTPERVESGEVTWWSCSSTTRRGDRALVYVAGSGVQYEWRAISNAQPDDEWKYVCDVTHVRTYHPPISLNEIRNVVSRQEWAPPHQNFRGFRSVIVPENAAILIRQLRQTNASLLPEEVSDVSGLAEGTVRRIAVNAYERNPEARRRCIEHYGDKCCICNISFGDTYGHDADGYIHVHHLRPLSEVGGEYQVDPVQDLRPVCPNCHAVLHMGGQCRSIDGVREMRRLAKLKRRRKQ